jgi:hypothetical protein
VQILALKLIYWGKWHLNWLGTLTAGRQFLADLFVTRHSPQIHSENMKKDWPDISNREHPHSTGQSSKNNRQVFREKEESNEKDQPLDFIVLDPIRSFCRYTRSCGRWRGTGLHSQDLPQSAANEVIFRYRQARCGLCKQGPAGVSWGFPYVVANFTLAGPYAAELPCRAYGPPWCL